MTEREQFEAWAKVRYAKNPHFWLRQIDDGGYSCGMADSAWNAWQVARAQPAQAVPVLAESELRSILQGTNHMIKNAMHGAFWPELEEACRAVEQAVRAKLGVAVWLPIEKAPVGKEMFVVRAFNVQVTDKIHGYTSDAYGVWQPTLGRFERWPHPFDPTHWMPLPPPPGIVGKEGA